MFCPQFNYAFNVGLHVVGTHFLGTYLANLHVRYFAPLKIVSKVNKNAIDPFAEVSFLDMVREKLKSSPFWQTVYIVSKASSNVMLNQSVVRFIMIMLLIYSAVYKQSVNTFYLEVLNR